MDMRIEFEAAMAKQLSSEGYSDFSIEMMFERGSDDEYRSIRINGAYWGWQASRESLVIELPPLEKSQQWMSDFDDGAVSGNNSAIQTMKYRLTSAGIITK